MEAIKAAPLQIGTATGPTALTKTGAHMAIVMTTPVMRTPHQVNKAALNNVRKETGEKTNEEDKRVLLGQEIEGLDV